MVRNFDFVCFQVVVCYNKDFLVVDLVNIDGQFFVEFRFGILNIDYECMYIVVLNQFFIEGDGGFINVSVNLGICRNR